MTIRCAPFVLAGIAFAAVIVTHLVNFGADDLRAQLLDANSDASWSHLLIAGTLAVATGICLLGARRPREQTHAWIAVTGILAFISFDEISSLHSTIDQMSWGKLVYTPILLALCLCLWKISARSARNIELRAGLVTLLISFGIHVFGPHIVHVLGYGTSSWLYQTKVALKQGTELAGWLLVVMGLSRIALSRPAR